MKTKIKMNQQTKQKTVKEGFKEFITYCKIKNLSEHTIGFYEDCYKTFITYLRDDISIDSINRNTVDSFILHLQQRKISSISVNTYIRGTRTFLYYCMKLNYLQEFKINIIKAEKKVKEIYTDAELQLLLEKPNLKDCSFTEYKCWVIINLLLTIPVRANTLINIKVKNLDFENELITLEKMKNRKQQTLPMGRILKRVLLEYLQYRKADTEEDYLFPNAYDEPLSVRTLEKSLSTYNKRRGVLRTGVHIYRNVYAKKWIVSGGDIFRLQKILNHNSLNMVREYVDMFTEDLQRDFDMFNALGQLQNQRTHIRMR